MSKKVINTNLCLFALFLGGVLYLLFRENAVISNLIENLCDLTTIRNLFLPFSNNILKYYLPDFLWAFSLCCGLNVLFEAKIIPTITTGIISFLCGCVWEILQYTDVVSGTADIIDIILYLAASITSVKINILILRRKK